MTLGFADVGIIVGIMSGFVSIPAAILIAQIKGVRDDYSKFSADIERELKRIDTRVSAVEQGSASMVSRSRIGMVTHEEWLRVSASQQNRIDRISEGIARLEGKIDASTGVASQIARVADALQDHGSGDGA